LEIQTFLKGGGKESILLIKDIECRNMLVMGAGMRMTPRLKR
jgi:hypothetical protein